MRLWKTHASDAEVCGKLEKFLICEKNYAASCGRKKFAASCGRVNVAKLFFVGTTTQVHCDHIWRNFTTLAKNYKSDKFLAVYCLFGKMLSLLWEICAFIGLIFIVINGQILKSNLTISSHYTELWLIL